MQVPVYLVLGSVHESAYKCTYPSLNRLPNELNLNQPVYMYVLTNIEDCSKAVTVYRYLRTVHDQQPYLWDKLQLYYWIL